jgi:hypothetical protein
MISKIEQLLELAKASEFRLNEPDLKLLQCVAAGKAADFSDKDEERNAPERAGEWGEERCLSAELIAWVCTDREARDFITHKGLRVIGAKIEGSLDLNFAQMEFPLAFLRCAFMQAIRLERAAVRLLDLSGSSVSASQILDDASGQEVTTALEARGLQVESDVWLRNGFSATGRVWLLGASIGGNLECDNGTFTNKGGTALQAQGAEIKGAVLLRNGFSATGTVWLSGASIGGNLQCDNGTFTNEAGIALVAEGAEIKGDLFLRNKFSATGLVSLTGASIGGDLDCANGKFSNEGRTALVAQSAEIKGTVFLRKGFSATGRVSLLGASIGGNFVCSKGTFSNATGDALLAQSAEIKGIVFLNDGFSAKGTVSLLGASIGGNLDCANGTFSNESGDALVAQGAEIKGAVLLRNGFSATGQVSLSGASIGSDLDCSKCTFSNEGGDALLAQGAEIKGNVLLRNKFGATGQVSLLGASIGGNLDCSKCTFSNEGRDALVAQGAEIKGAVLLRNGFSATGQVSLVGASIGDGLELRAIGSGDMELDLQLATTSTLIDEKDSWPLPGKLDLDGFTYEKIANGSPVKGSERLDWIRRQNLEASFSPQPYEQAARVLRASGHEQAAIEVLIGKQEDLRQFGDLSRIGWFWNWLLGHTIAHGYKPHYALYGAAGFIAAGTTLFGVGYGQDPRLISPANVAPFEAAPATAPQLSENYPKFNALVYSLDVFVPIVDFHQKSYWLPNANRGAEIPLVFLKTGALLRWYFWLHIVAGWVLTSLWVAGFTGLVRRLE